MAPPPKKIKGAGNLSAVQAVTGVQQRDPATPYTPTPQEQAKKNTQTQRTLARQRLLKAAGYPVVVDGIWGPKSQQAWDNYKNHPRGPFIPVQQVQQQEGAQIRAEQSRLQAVQAQAAAAKSLAQDRARLKAIRVEKARVLREVAKTTAVKTAESLAHERHVVLQRAAKLMGDPTLARGMTLRQVSSVLDDKAFDYNPIKNQTHALIIQNWLYAHGKIAKITGKYDKATNDAIVHEWHAQQQAEHDAQVKSITAQLYAPGVLHPGERPDWWPLDTPIPKPGDLYNILSHKSFDSSAILLSLKQELTKPQAGFERWRKQELLTLAAHIQPFGLTLSGIFGPQAQSDFELYSNMLGSNPWNQHGHFGGDGLTGADTRTDWQKKKDYNKQLQLTAHLDSLVNASSVKDFQIRQTAEMFRMETQRIQDQQHHASTWAKYLGSAAEYALAPGKFMRTALIADVQGGLDFAINGDASYLLGNEEERAAHWAYAEQSLANFKSHHGVWGFAYEVLADPLNLIGPVRLSSFIVRSSLQRTGLHVAEVTASKLGGYTLKTEEGAGKLIGIIPKGAKVTYESAGWPSALRGLTARGVEKIPGIGEPTVDFGRKLLTSKQEMISTVTHRVNVAARNAFGDTIIGGKILNGAGPRAATKKAVQDGHKGMMEHIDRRMAADPTYRDTVQALVDDHASIYHNFDRGSNHTNVGASMIAAYAEGLKSQLVARTVSQAAKDIIDRGTAEGVAAWRVEREVLESTEQIVKASGSFVQGAIDRRITIGDVQINKVIEDGVAAGIDQFENVYLPALQSVLERENLKNGKSLWDNYGKWDSEASAASQKLREQTREAFDAERTVRLDNPAWGNRYDSAHALEMKEGEISRRQYRVYAHHAREVEGGKTFAENWARDEAQKIRNDVEKHWHRLPSGSWYDDREFLQVPDIYARSHMETFYLTPEAERRVTPDQFLAAVERGNFSPLQDFRGEDMIDAVQTRKKPAAVISASEWIPRHISQGEVDVTHEELLAAEHEAEAAFHTRMHELRRKQWFVKIVKHPDTTDSAIIARTEEAGKRLEKIWHKPLTGNAAKDAARDIEIGRALGFSEDDISFFIHRNYHGDFWHSTAGPHYGYEQLSVRDLAGLMGKGGKAATRDPWAGYFEQREAWALKREEENNALNARMADSSSADYHPDDEWVSGYEKSQYNMGSAELWDHQEKLRAERAAKKMDFRPDPRSRVKTPKLKPVSDLAALGDRPLLRGQNAFVDSLEQLSWDLGGGFKKLPSVIKDVNPLDNVSNRAVDKVAARQHIYGPEEKAAREAAAAFREHMDHQTNLLAQASDESMAGELVSEMAIYRAFAESQSRVMQRAYKIIEGGLNNWKFATLVLRPAWMVRNIVDNWSKLWVAGVRDPRAYFLGAKNPGSLIGSVFDFGVREMLGITRFLDTLMGGDGKLTAALEKLTNSFWSHSSETLQRIFRTYDIDIPQHVLDGMRLDPWEDMRITRRLKKSVAEGTATDEEKTMYEKLREGYEYAKDKNQKLREILWDLTGNRPENYFRRVLYRDEFAKVKKQALKDLLNDSQAERFAHERALKKVNDTLFDYSDVTVIEDNLKVFFPFIQFWQKNVKFWSKAALGEKPWLAPGLVKYEQTMSDAHEDRPDWMRRYFDTSTFTDIAAKIPGGEWIAKALIPGGAQYDPLNMTSFGQLWRFFKQENQGLPPDKQGIAFVSDLIDSLNNTGLGMNPVAYKFLQNVGVANTRSWQTVYPGTSIVAAFTRDYISERWADRILDTERIFTAFMGKAPSDQIAENMNFYVQQEMADQALKGEPVDRKKAEDAIKDWFFLQNLSGYFVGTYYRRATPEDIYLQKLNQDVFDGKKLLNEDKTHGPHFYNGERVFPVTPNEKKALNLFYQKGADELSFDRYVHAYPTIQAYYANSDFKAGEAMLMEHPEIVPYISRFYAPFKDSFLQTVNLRVQGSDFFFMDGLMKNLDVPYDLRKQAEASLLTPELKASWHKHDTPAKIKNRQIQGEAFRYYSNLNAVYHNIPTHDYAAKDDFLKSHPELVQYWTQHNSPADDYEALMTSANQTLRTIYYDTQREHGWDAANAFLKQYPFMFENTKAASKVDQETGAWKPQTKYARAYLDMKPQLDWFFDDYLHKVGKDKAFEWLYGSNTAQAKAIRDFLKLAREHDGKAPLKSNNWSAAHHLAYIAAKGWLKVYFDMSKEDRSKWLDANSDGAKIVKAYFDKWGHAKGMTQHGKDYLAIKPLMERYFKLTKAERRKLLDSKSPDAMKLLDYFKKYGKQHQHQRAFLKGHPTLIGGTPDQKLRLAFWQKYFLLTPDLRPAFVAQEADKHGVFVYGVWGQEERHDRELAYYRTVIGHGTSKRQAAYLYIKPLMDFFQTVPKDQKALFLRANPELQHYFNLYVHTSLTGNKKVDKTIEAYFALPEDSDARSKFLGAHPEVQAYFDKKSSPAERAIRAVVTAYFNMAPGDERTHYLELHPEIQTYFDSRRKIKDNETLQLEAFDHADPRLAPFFAFGDESILPQGAIMRRILREQAMNKHRPHTIETRRSRRALDKKDKPVVRQSP